MGGEVLSRIVLGLWDKILEGLQQVRAIAHRRQVLDLLPKNSTGFDRPSSKDKAKDLAKDGIDRYSVPAFGFFLATKLQSSPNSIKEQACVLGWFSVHIKKSGNLKSFEIFSDFRESQVFSVMGENNMPETSEQSAPLELLIDQVQEIFSWHRSIVYSSIIHPDSIVKTLVQRIRHSKLNNS